VKKKKNPLYFARSLIFPVMFSLNKKKKKQLTGKKRMISVLSFSLLSFLMQTSFWGNPSLYI